MFTDKNEQAPPAAFIPACQTEKLRCEILRVELLKNARDLGMEDVTSEKIEEAEKRAGNVLLEICENHTREAVRNGSIYDKYNLPQFFRNESGIENPVDPAVIEGMASARGQILNNE